MEGGRERGRERGREGGREGEKEGGRKGGREGGREGGEGGEGGEEGRKGREKERGEREGRGREDGSEVEVRQGTMAQQQHGCQYNERCTTMYTSSRKMSITLNATLRESTDANMVRNHAEAYIDVWKPCNMEKCLAAV